jgi:hypothetical protein
VSTAAERLSYEGWADRNGEERITAKKLGAKLAARRYAEKRTGKMRGRVGLRLRNERDA